MIIGVGVAAAILVAFVVLNLISLKSKFFPFNISKSFFFISILSVFGSNIVQVPLPFSALNRCNSVMFASVLVFAPITYALSSCLFA